MKVLITPRSFKNVKEKAYPLLEQQHYEIIENQTGRTLTEEEIIKLAHENVAGIIVGIDPLSARVLTACRDLKAVSKYGVGLDNIDLQTAERLRIKVKNALGSNTISVAELAIAFMFEAARRVSLMNARVKNGAWERVQGFELTGKRLGLIGGGAIGKEVAKRARGLCMQVQIYDPYFEDSSFLENFEITLCGSLSGLLAGSDIVSLHVPLTSETRNMINRAALESMKPTAVLINTARGELVDEESLYRALREGIIALAAQDVFSKEPPARGEKLLTLDNFLLTPHTGAYTSEAVERMAFYSVQNLIEMLKQ